MYFRYGRNKLDDAIKEIFGDDALTNSSEKELTVVLDYYEAMETYSRIGLLRSYRNLQPYLTTCIYMFVSFRRHTYLLQNTFRK